MTARILPPTGRAAQDAELLAQLGLPASTAPEDLDQLHQAVTEYLAGAPAGLRGWAHAQAAALDAAYLQLTDPVGLQGSALRSPTRPPTVEPGGPATPPARRDPVPVPNRLLHAAAPVTAPVAAPDEASDEAADGDDANDDLDALFASVTPSVHRDSLPDRRPKRARIAAKPAATAPRAGARGVFVPWRRLVIGAVTLGVAAGIALAGYNAGGGGQAAAGGNGNPTASSGAPAIDEAKVASLMQQLQANPRDTATLLALANEFYAGGLYDNAGEWLDKVIAIEPRNVQALLARGAVSFNLGDLVAAETTWQKVVAIEPDNVEVHYDLGFLYLNQQPPDMAGVRREWTKVVELGPGTQLAQTVQSHLDSLAASSMLPSASPAGSPAASAPAASPSASPVASPAASAPAASPAASPAP